MEESTATATPGPIGLRAGGFLVTVAGTLMTGIGAMLGWAEVGLIGNRARPISPTYLGVDLLEGKIVIGLSVICLTCVLLARVGRKGARRWAAAVVLVGGVAILVTTGVLAVAGSDRLRRDAVTDLNALRDQGGNEELIDDVAAMVEARLQPGVWITMAGGALITIGGALSLAWTRRTGPTGAGSIALS